MFGAAIGPSQTEITNAQNDAKDLEKQLSTKSKTIASLESQNKDLQEKVDEAAPWFEMKEDERKQLEAEAKAEEEKRKAEAKAKAKAAAEAEEKRLAEEEAKKGYNTGITYNQLARTPDEHSKVKWFK